VIFTARDYHSAMRWVVAGASGLIGRALREAVDVTPLPRGSADVDGADVVVCLSGATIGKRWSAAYKQEILASRVETTRRLASAIAALDRKPRVFICASAVGYYGDTGDTEVDESAPPGEGFLAEVCRAWEEASKGAGVRTVNLRTAVVLSPKGGPLAQMLPPFRAGVGGPMGGGRQWFPWIHVEDAVTAMRHLAEVGEGAYNVVAPGIVRQKDFAKALGRVLGRPAVVPTPAWAVRAMFGDMGRELLCQGQRAVPRRLLDSGFTFRYPSVEEALRACVGTR
jgi:hypothetical protein